MSETQENYLTDIEIKQIEIINHYGMDKQLDQIIEECAELIQAISKYKRYQNEDSQVRMIAEIADVENLIEQLKLKDEFLKSGVRTVKEYKANRELDRIKTRHKIG